MGSEYAAKTARFEEKLVEWSDWTRTNILIEWLDESNPFQRRFLSQELFKTLTKQYLSGWLLEEGITRLLDFADRIATFEDIILASRTGFQQEIYRDHLNHTIRVSLLCNAIANQSGKTKQEADLVTIAGLLHDVALPLQEARPFMGETAEALLKCYQLFDFPEVRPELNLELYTKFLSRLHEATGLSRTEIVSHVLKYNHSALGALEFLGNLDEDLLTEDQIKNADAIAAAIYLHDRKIGGSVNLDTNWLAGVLVLADEMQEWGRPVSEPGGNVSIQLARIDKPNLEKVVSGVFDYSSQLGFPFYMSIYDKSRNFHRLTGTGNLESLQLTFKPPTEIIVLKVTDVLRNLIKIINDTTSENDEIIEQLIATSLVRQHKQRVFLKTIRDLEMRKDEELSQLSPLHRLPTTKIFQSFINIHKNQITGCYIMRDRENV